MKIHCFTFKKNKQSTIQRLSNMRQINPKGIMNKVKFYRSKLPAFFKSKEYEIFRNDYPKF